MSASGYHDRQPETDSQEKHGCISAPDVGGSCPWSLGPGALGLWQCITAVHEVEETSSTDGDGEMQKETGSDWGPQSFSQWPNSCQWHQREDLAFTTWPLENIADRLRQTRLPLLSIAIVLREKPHYQCSETP